jgi:zinc/manganese transport system substrate-binding protein
MHIAKLLLPLAFALLLPATALAAGLNVVAAENFYGDVTRQIGGSDVSVTSILSDPETDPHLFETSASTARAVSDATVIVYNGADYDPWMDKLLSASPNADRATIVAADLIGAKSGDNPHLWYDPHTLPAVAKALAREFAKRDPDDATTFAANLATFDGSLKPIDAEIASIKAAHAGIEVTATEPVFGYMASALGLDMLNYDFQVATMNDTEPSPSQVAGFESSLKTGKAKILFYNAQVTDDTTTRLLRLAKDAHVPVIGVTETEPEGKTIQTWFGGQLQEVSAALDALAK